MGDSPVFQSSSDIRTWRRVRGEGINSILDSARGGTDGLVDEILSREGSVHPAILIALMDRMGGKGQRLSPETLSRLVQKARVTDCSPSIRAAQIMLEQGDPDSAAQILSISARSREVLHRCIASARIYIAQGNLTAARESAERAYATDQGCPEVYDILKEIDPDGGWGQRQNIQAVLSGARPENPPGSGRLQELYSIYYEWFRGSHDDATDHLVNSQYYKDRDPEFLLASARISVDEKDWHSASMMYDNLLDGAGSYILCEAAESNIAAGDPDKAIRILSDADRTSRRVMACLVSAYDMRGDHDEMMDAVRTFLDNEYSGKDDYESQFRMLMGRGMHEDAGTVLARLRDSYPHDPIVLSLQSEHRMGMGDITGAMMYAARAVRRDPKSIQARLQKARVLYMTGKVEAAGRECDYITRRDPENLGCMVLTRDIQLSNGDSKAALGTCERILRADPSDVVTMRALAGARMDLGDGPGSLEMLRSALRHDQSRDNAFEVVGMMVSSGFSREAVGACIDLERQYPRDPMVKRLKGNAEYAMGDYLRASVTFASAAALSPHDPILWHSKGMADEARGDYESAEEAFNRAVLLDLGVPEFWISKSSVQERRGDLHGAVESLNRVIELDPRSVYALVRKSKIFSSAGRFDEAIHYLGIASVISPDDRDILREKARAEVSAGRYDAAVATGEAVMALGGGDDDSLELALCYMRVGQPSKAVKVLDDALATNPASVPLLRARAEASISSGDADAALRICRDLETAAPDDPGVRRFIIDINRSMGKMSEADDEPPEQDPFVTDDEEVPGVVGHVPEREDPSALNEMASSLLGAGDVKGAMRAVDRALSIEPDDPRHIRLKAEIVLASGDRDGAAVLVNTALREFPVDPGLHEILGDIRASGGDLRGAVIEYNSAMGYGADPSRINLKRGDMQDRLGNVDGAIQCYNAALAKDPGDLDTLEKLAGLEARAGINGSAIEHLTSVVSRDPRRVTAIVRRAELYGMEGDDDGVMLSYVLFRKCPSPGADATVRMVRVLEDMGHGDEAGQLMGSKPKGGDADKVVMRYAEKAMRRAFATRTPADDPDSLASLGLDPDMSRRVIAYLADIPDYGRISPGTDEFRRMERVSHDVVTRMGWSDLEGSPRLPLENVFVTGSFKEADDAKALVAYVFKVMHYDVGRKADPRLEEMSMRLPKGMTVYEIMQECSVGVYEAKVIQTQII